METSNLIENLVFFSNQVISIPLASTKLESILYYGSSEFLQEVYIENDNYFFQTAITEAKESTVTLILKNLSKAIETNCNNSDINLSKISDDEQISYSVKTNNEKSISKRYKDYTIYPKDENKFKEIWLKQFVENLINIKYNILDITSIHFENPTRTKLKTNLTVKQIAYLFRALYDEGIIESKHKTDICNFIAESFSSKQKEDVSANSLRNAFESPDFNAVDFWHEKFTHLMQRAKKDKEK